MEAGEKKEKGQRTEKSREKAACCGRTLPPLTLATGGGERTGFF